MRFIHPDMRGRIKTISLSLAAIALASILLITLAQFNTTGAQTGDYDSDDDGLIDITSMAQLNAVRYDLDGNGLRDFIPAADWAAYTAAFPNAQTGMGCPASGCAGYELAQDLTAGSYGSWTPIGNNAIKFSATFKGNGYAISNLTITTAYDPIGLFGGSSGTITGVALKNVNINVNSTSHYVDLGTLVGDNTGTVTESYATGSISATLGQRSMIGGLIGYNGGEVHAVYSNVSGNITVSATTAADRRIYLGGLIGDNSGTGRITAAYSIGSVRGSGESSFVAGLVGINSGTVSASYSTSAVSSASDSATTAGLLGTSRTSANPTVRASYWDTQTSGQTASIGGGIGKTTSELQTPITASGSIYSDWIPARWDFGASTQYPALKADFNGDGTATWQEFGSQRGNAQTAHPTPTPTSVPTAAATHTPTATPETTPTRPSTAGCVAAISANASVSGKWSSACLASNTPDGAQPGKRYAGFYTFTLNAPASVTISLTSPDVADTYLYLLQGDGRDGAALHRNNDISADNRHSRISQRLQAGTYTIEATTYHTEVVGSFTLAIEVSPSQTPDATPISATPTPTATRVSRPAATPTSEIPPAVQQRITELERTIAELRAMITDMRTEFERRLADLEGAAPAATPTSVPTATPTATSIARVSDPTATPTSVPTAASTPADPTATPTPDGCTQRLAGLGWVTGAWTSACTSDRKPTDANAPEGTRYARFYTFTLDSTSNVTVSLSSTTQDARNTYLFLLSGAGRSGDALTENDNIDAENGNYASRITSRLPAGSYTIEATTYNLKTTGDFTLTLDISTAP